MNKQTQESIRKAVASLDEAIHYLYHAMMVADDEDKTNIASKLDLIRKQRNEIELHLTGKYA